jgi:glycosyltransferase involved in cell wall biosynthesis
LNAIRPPGTTVTDGSAGRFPLTVLLPVLNEEKNLPAALASVLWAGELIVVDSHSTDRTAAIAKAYGAAVVQFAYDGTGPKKKSWALQNLTFRNEWVLILDADERVTRELREEIEDTIRTGSADGYCLDREFVFMGRSLRCFRPNWNVRLFRHDGAGMEDLGLTNLPGTGDNEIHEHIKIDGELGFLKNPLLHDDYRGIGPWIDRHNRYATWEAHLYMKFQNEPIGTSPMQFFHMDSFHRKRVLRRVWAHLPLRPFLRFVVWYFFRLGILDGRQGYVFCLLMAWYELLVGLKIDELKKAGVASRGDTVEQGSLSMTAGDIR